MKYIIYYSSEFNDYVNKIKVNKHGLELCFTRNIKYAKTFKSKEEAINILKEVYDEHIDQWLSVITIATKDEILIKNIIE